MSEKCEVNEQHIREMKKASHNNEEAQLGFVIDTITHRESELACKLIRYRSIWREEISR